MKRFNRTITIAMMAVMILMPVSTFAASFSPTWKETVPTNNKRKDNCRPITNSGYLDTQGVAFDIYSTKDGYAFNKGTDGKKDFQLVHFTMKGNKITKKGYVKYKTANVGHANDGTIFRWGGKKYLLFAVSGGKELASKTYDGKTCKLGVIWLDEYNKGVAKVRAVKIKTNDDISMPRDIPKANFSGITYTGMRAVEGANRPVFVIKDGMNLYAAYFTINDAREITLTIFDRAKVEKPKIKYKGKKYDSSTQGITFHNGYVYIPFSGETAKAINQNMIIGRITYNKLFAGSQYDTKVLQTYNKRIDKYKAVVKVKKGKKVYKTKALAKYIPEAIFFKTLNGNKPMYMAVNRASTASKAKDVDAVVVSKQKF
ncbi:MAG: hypothetical protein IJH57_01890 [Mogibacterium sp.]|nr:hypothetical protein [Mogibacterium sp.]